MILAGRLAADLRYTTVDEILAAGLHFYIDDLQSRLNDIGTSIFETFVLYAELTPVGYSTAAPWQQGAWPENSKTRQLPTGVFNTSSIESWLSAQLSR